MVIQDVDAPSALVPTMHNEERRSEDEHDGRSLFLKTFRVSTKACQHYSRLSINCTNDMFILVLFEVLKKGHFTFTLLTLTDGPLYAMVDEVRR